MFIVVYSGVFVVKMGCLSLRVFKLLVENTLTSPGCLVPACRSLVQPGYDGPGGDLGFLSSLYIIMRISEVKEFLGPLCEETSSAPWWVSPFQRPTGP